MFSVIALADRQNHVSKLAPDSAKPGAINPQEFDDEDQCDSFVAVDARLALCHPVEERRSLFGQRRILLYPAEGGAWLAERQLDGVPVARR